MKRCSLFGLLCLFLISQSTNGAIDWSKRKVNCGVSAWSEWKCVGSSCGRTRAVLRDPLNGGLACGPLEEIKPSNSKESPWDQKNVVAKVQSKFISGNGRVLTLAKTASQKGGQVLQSRDLIILLDMSGSISKAEFQKTKQKMGEMVALICGTIGQTRQHNRIAVISFSRSVKLNFDFKTYYDLKAVKDAIMKIPQERKTTCTGDALNYAHTKMFEPTSGIRDATQSVKEVLVLTDGRSNCGKPLHANVKQLQVKAFVYALAIGKFSDKGRKEIESMVSRPLIDHIFSLSNFQTFFEMVEALKTYPSKCVPFELSR